MKTKFSGGAAVAAFLVATGGIVAATARAHHAPPTPKSPAPPQAGTSPTLIAGYKNWKRVNPEPVPLSALATMLCRSLTPKERAQLSASGAKNPHLDNSAKAPEDRQRFATVYVNSTGADAMFKEAQPKFPVGSVIVKEKLTTPTSETPELLTVMRKREKGYNPPSGDWEYLVLDGKGAKVQAQGRLETCEASCHAARKETDYVYRDDYLPWQFRRDLK